MMRSTWERRSVVKMAWDETDELRREEYVRFAEVRNDVGAIAIRTRDGVPP